MANPESSDLIKIKTNNRRYNPVATIFVFVLVLLIGLAFLYSPRLMKTVEAPDATRAATTTIEGTAMKRSEPTRIIIPKIKLEAPFSDSLGRASSGEVEVPKDYVSVGYYKNGPTPGQLGPAVVLGHVDSYKGPAVFFSLGQLAVGDEITIERADDTTVTFAVTEMERNSQSDFPTAKVYSNLNYAGLRLITCTGIFDKGKQRYSHNLIVYAKLVRTGTVEK